MTFVSSKLHEVVATNGYTYCRLGPNVDSNFWFETDFKFTYSNETYFYKLLSNSEYTLSNGKRVVGLQQRKDMNGDYNNIRYLVEYDNNKYEAINVENIDDVFVYNDQLNAIVSSI